GAVPLGVEVVTELFVRNDGSSDSVLTLTDATLTPTNAGFSVELPDLAETGTLSSFAGFCPGDDVAECPTTASTCTDGLCLDDDGALLDALALVVRFSATNVGAKQATLTLKYQDQGLNKQLEIELSA